MLYSLLYPLADHFGALQCLPLHHLPHRRRRHDGALVSFLFGPGLIRWLQKEAARGPADPRSTVPRATC